MGKYLGSCCIDPVCHRPIYYLENVKFFDFINGIKSPWSRRIMKNSDQLLHRPHLPYADILFGKCLVL